jgi:hypothetical protein
MITKCVGPHNNERDISLNRRKMTANSVVKKRQENVLSLFNIVLYIRWGVHIKN